MRRGGNARKLSLWAEVRLRRTLRLADGELPASRSARSIQRGTAVVGLLLEGVGDRYHTARRRFHAFVADTLRGAWTMVELAAPQDPAAIIPQYWIAAVLALGIAVTLIGAITSREHMVPLGLAFAAAGVMLHFLSERLRRFLLRPVWVVVVTLAMLCATSWFGWRLLVQMATADEAARAAVRATTADRIFDQIVYLLTTGSPLPPGTVVEGVSIQAVELLLRWDTVFVATYCLWVVALGSLVAFFSRGFTARPHVAMLGVFVLTMVAGVSDLLENLFVWWAVTRSPELWASNELKFATLGKHAGLIATAILLFNLLRIAIEFRFIALVLSSIDRLQRISKLTSAFQRSGGRPTNENRPGAERRERPKRTLSAPATRIIAQTVHLADPDPERVSTARAIARGTRIVGELFQSLSAARYPSAGPLAAWVTRSGRFGGVLLELSVPKSLGSIFYLHWFGISLSIICALFLLGWLARVPAISNTAATLFLFITAAALIHSLLRSWLRGHSWLDGLGVPATLLGAFLIARSLIKMDHARLLSSWTPDFPLSAGWTVENLLADFALIGGYSVFLIGVGLLAVAETPLRLRNPRLTNLLLTVLCLAVGITVAADSMENVQQWAQMQFAIATRVKLVAAASAVVVLVGLMAAAWVSAVKDEIDSRMPRRLA
jgi:hypothetical protein